MFGVVEGQSKDLGSSIITGVCFYGSSTTLHIIAQCSIQKLLFSFDLWHDQLSDQRPKCKSVRNDFEKSQSM